VNATPLTAPAGWVVINAFVAVPNVVVISAETPAMLFISVAVIVVAVPETV